jgi:hypothetical protein
VPYAPDPVPDPICENPDSDSRYMPIMLAAAADAAAHLALALEGCRVAVSVLV